MEKEPGVQIRLKSKKAEQPAMTKPSKLAFPASPGMELDLRGQRADEALATLDRYLDSPTWLVYPGCESFTEKEPASFVSSAGDTESTPTYPSFEPGAENEGGDV